jgi:hypothetical protein
VIRHRGAPAAPGRRRSRRTRLCWRRRGHGGGEGGDGGDGGGGGTGGAEPQRAVVARAVVAAKSDVVVHA